MHQNAYLTSSSLFLRVSEEKDQENKKGELRWQGRAGMVGRVRTEFEKKKKRLSHVIYVFHDHERTKA